jgi:hypothetical protein
MDKLAQTRRFHRRTCPDAFGATTTHREEKTMEVKYLQVPVGDYGSITVEIEPTPEAYLSETLGVTPEQPPPEWEGEGEKVVQPLGLEEDVERAIETSVLVAADAFDAVSDTVYAVARGFQDCMKRVEPDEASVEFGISVSGEAGVVLKVKGESSFTVTLTWKKEP